jgi:hypothetical protein
VVAHHRLFLDDEELTELIVPPFRNDHYGGSSTSGRFAGSFGSIVEGWTGRSSGCGPTGRTRRQYWR